MTATYRLQIRGAMTLARARELVAYLDALGFSQLYASPLLRARVGSTHGYDVVDPETVDPALGGLAALGPAPGHRGAGAGQQFRHGQRRDRSAVVGPRATGGAVTDGRAAVGPAARRLLSHRCRSRRRGPPDPLPDWSVSPVARRTPQIGDRPTIRVPRP